MMNQGLSLWNLEYVGCSATIPWFWQARILFQKYRKRRPVAPLVSVLIWLGFGDAEEKGDFSAPTPKCGLA